MIFSIHLIVTVVFHQLLGSLYWFFRLKSKYPDSLKCSSFSMNVQGVVVNLQEKCLGVKVCRFCYLLTFWSHSFIHWRLGTPDYIVFLFIPVLVIRLAQEHPCERFTQYLAWELNGQLLSIIFYHSASQFSPMTMLYFCWHPEQRHVFELNLYYSNVCRSFLDSLASWSSSQCPFDLTETSRL